MEPRKLRLSTLVLSSTGCFGLSIALMLYQYSRKKALLLANAALATEKISFTTIYNEISFFYTLFFTTSLLFFTGVIYLLITDIIRKRNTGIVALNNGCYLIGHLLFNPQKQTLQYRKRHRISSRTTEMLLLFLVSEDNRVSKKELLEGWQNQQNMTTYIYRVKQALEKAGCRYHIRNYRAKGYYRLEPIEKKKWKI